MEAIDAIASGFDHERIQDYKNKSYSRGDHLLLLLGNEFYGITGGKMNNYNHKVQYYETDKMGITHHSNYIRWMEEARVAFLSEIGFPYDQLEEMGIVSPVLSVSCEYRKPTTFSDQISIVVSVKEYKGVKLHLEYEMRNSEGNIVCFGTSAHAFLTKEGRPVRMKQDYPELNRVLTELAEKGSQVAQSNLK